MTKRLLLLTLSLSGFLTYAQEENENQGTLNIGIESNSQWYIEDDMPLKADEKALYEEEKFRTNNYIKADYFIGKWEFGLQVESYTPAAIANYSPNFEKTDVGIMYARYNNSDIGLDVTAGHFYEQFGSGLILRTWEDRQLGINNAIFGGRIGYDFVEGAKLTVLGGKQRVGMGFDLSDSFISGANLDFSVSQLAKMETVDLNFGLSYVGRYENLQNEYPEIDKMTNMYAVRADMTKGGFYLGAEYVYKTDDALVEDQGKVILEDKKYDGNALLLNMGYSEKGFGLDVNLRRIENMGLYSERNLTGNTYNTGVLNYVPALTKQYDFALQNIYVYQVATTTTFSQLLKPGEIGGQFDLYYEFAKETTFGGKYGTYVALNGSFWNALDYGDDLSVEDKQVSTGFFDLGRKYYNDLALEVRKKFSEKWQSVFSVMGQYYNQKYIEDTSGELRTQIMAGEVIYKFSDTKSLRFIGQHLWADGDKKNWAAGVLEFVPSLKWSFYVQDLYNYGNDKKDERLHYYNVGGAFAKGATRIGLSYGRQRGGMICVGGVCRLVSPFSGLTLNISTNF